MANTFLPTPPAASEKSCLTCPSYLSEPETSAYFTKSVNAPRCAKFGVVLALPNATEFEAQATARAIGASCHSHGDPRPTSTPVTVNSVVFLPDPKAASTVLELNDPLKQQVRSCTNCVNLVSDVSVAKEAGFASGVCRAKGSLILSNQRGKSAKDCQLRVFGNHDHATITDLTLLPVYSIKPPPSPPLPKAPAFIESSAYPSDLKVTDEDKQHGIRAWRRIVDPEGYGDDTWLPIFDFDSFSEEEQECIPRTGDDNRPEKHIDYDGKVYQVAVLWGELNQIPAFWGMPGCGKSELASHIAWLMGIPFYRFPINEATELDELAGRKEYTPELGTHFVEGRLTKAWTRRAVILVDEPNTGRNEVWTFLRPMFDGQQILTLDIDRGQQKKRGLFTYPALAMNPAWSPLNVGTSVIGAADASRLMHLEFNLPPEDVERRILVDRAEADGWEMDQARLDFVIKVGELLRGLCADGTLSMTWAVRESIKVSRALRWFPPLRAFSIAGADYLEPAQRDAVLDQVRAALPRAPFPKIKEIQS